MLIYSKDVMLYYHGKIKTNKVFKSLVDFKVTVDVNQVEIDITDKLDVDELRKCKAEFFEMHDEEMRRPFDNPDHAYESQKENEGWDK